jgi:hypothetical protein
MTAQSSQPRRRSIFSRASHQGFVGILRIFDLVGGYDSWELGSIILGRNSVEGRRGYRRPVQRDNVD